MNILLASDGNIERAGICLFLLRWGREVLRMEEGNKVIVYFRKKVLVPALLEEYRESGLEVVTGDLPGSASCAKKKNQEKIRADIRGILSRIPIDIVHTNSGAFGFSSIILKECARAGVKMRVAHCHGKIEFNQLKWMYLIFLRREILRYATVRAACSEEAGAYFFGRKIAKEGRYAVVPSVIDAEEFEFSLERRGIIREKLGIGENTLLLGAGGTLTPDKNYGFLLEVLHELKERASLQCALHLVLMGDGPEKEMLVGKTEMLGLMNEVTFYGQTGEVSGLMSAMDIFLLPSRIEGFGMVAVEAQASGLYCLLSDRAPERIKVTSKACFLPIDQGSGIWAAKIEELAQDAGNISSRVQGVQEVNEAGLGRGSLAGQIQRLYKWEKK